MAHVTHSVEISRRPEEVFAYLDDIARHAEWQRNLVSARVDTPGPIGVGTRVTEVRRAGGREMTMSYEVTEHEPPRRFGFRTLDGPIRPVGQGIVESLDDGARSRLTIELDLVGHGIGKLLAPLARMQAKKEVPHDHAELKRKLEAG